MASSMAVCGIRMRGRGSVLRCLQKVDRFLHRRVETNAAAVQAKEARGHRSDDNAKDGRRSLCDLQAERREQAEKSVLISCPSTRVEKKLIKFLSRHGDVKNLFFYESCGVKAVVEFGSQEGVASLMESISMPGANHEDMVPYKSRLLSLSNVGSLNSASQDPGPQCQQKTLAINKLILRLSQKESIEQQITALTESYQLTEENSRLRFLVCSLVKDMATAYFPESTIRLFGSSVNGFGKMGCDLDMLLDLDGISGRNATTPKSGLFLEYQMKWASSERKVTQSLLSVIAECVDKFGPGCVGVQKILNARCPLVRFSHQPSGFQCDVTANNRVAMKSTELLYLYGQLDPRVRDLVFTVRHWARAHGLTCSIPGAWITNFSLTIMVLFFLQKRSPPVIPTLDHLRDLAGPEDKCVIEGHDCTFVSDFAAIRLHGNTTTTDQLLCEFLEFYGTFPFQEMSVNIRKGIEESKPEVAPLHIQNPFEPSLNVSKNVNATQLKRFVTLCQESVWLLQQGKTKDTGGQGNPVAWGVAALLLPTQSLVRKVRRTPASSRIKSLLESFKNNKVIDDP